MIVDKKNLHIEKNVYICGEEHQAAQNTVTDCMKQIASTLLPLALFLLPIRILGQSGSYEAYLLDAYPHESDQPEVHCLCDKCVHHFLF